jgi:hypothetical protein
MKRLERFSKVDSCKGCGREILWGRTQAGKWVPVDPEFVSVYDGAGHLVRGHIPHHATCPNVEDFRK